MSQVRFRRVARLEKRALPYIERKRRYEEGTAASEASAREEGFITVANLALLILYGGPKIGEPLICAWRRCLESKAWKACREKHSDYFGRHGGEEKSPFDDQGAQSIAQYFREYILPDLPGADETEKLNAAFAMAPAWLLWFTHGEVAGVYLGLNMPDFSSKSRFARPRINLDHLPEGPFEWRLLPDGAEDEFLTILHEFERKKLALLTKLTPRERMRALRLQESGETGGGGSASVTDRRPARRR
jgi:hypothetical protein